MHYFFQGQATHWQCIVTSQNIGTFTDTAVKTSQFAKKYLSFS